MLSERIIGKTVRLPSRVYYELYAKGGDELIALFSILKAAKQNVIYYPYYNSNNFKVAGYGLLRKQTGLSLHCLQKYMPDLVELGLVEFLHDGGVYIKGTNKLKSLYKNRKLVPVMIGSTFKETQYHCYSVRLFSCRDNQLKQIQRKYIQKEKFIKAKDPRNYSQVKLYKKRAKGKLRNPTITDTVILSNDYYAKLKNGQTSKTRGIYLKRMLKQKGLVETNRRFERIQRMNASTFRNFKKYSTELSIGRYKLRGGFLVEELVSDFNPITRTKNISKSKNKPIAISFDFIDWLQQDKSFAL